LAQSYLGLAWQTNFVYWLDDKGLYKAYTIGLKFRTILIKLIIDPALKLGTLKSALMNNP